MASISRRGMRPFDEWLANRMPPRDGMLHHTICMLNQTLPLKRPAVAKAHTSILSLLRAPSVCTSEVHNPKATGRPVKHSNIRRRFQIKNFLIKSFACFFNLAIEIRLNSGRSAGNHFGSCSTNICLQICANCSAASSHLIQVVSYKL